MTDIDPTPTLAQFEQAVDKLEQTVMLAVSVATRDGIPIGESDLAAARAALTALFVTRRVDGEAKKDGIHFVRVYESLVQQLRAAPSEPVTLQIEERDGRELRFTATRHDCPNADTKRLDWLEQNNCDLIAPMVVPEFGERPTPWMVTGGEPREDARLGEADTARAAIDAARQEAGDA